MSNSPIQRVLGLLLTIFSLSMLPPIAFSLIYDDGTWIDFVESFLIVAGVGLLLWFPARKTRRDLRLRDGFLVVALFWIVLGLFGAAPLILSERPDVGFTDAVFESMSGLTTTGATVLTGLDTLPPAILYYRAQLQWFGGLGIIVLAVAVLPMLGVGGMQLFRAELPGPVKDAKLTPKITKTAAALWYIYLGITVACCLAYWAAGMSFFDALCHSLTTVAIGGFSTHDLSFAYFDSVAIELIAVFFMIVSAANFTLHFLAFRERSVRHYLADPEFTAYIRILVVLFLIVVLYLVWQQTYPTLGETLRSSLFQAVSIATTAGFTTDSFAAWPGALPVLLLFSSFIGGCAASTAGGMKVVRWTLMYRQGMRELQRLVHPSAEVPVKLGAKAVHPRIVDAVWGFFAVYVVVFVGLLVVMMMTGMDQSTAFSAVAATLNNLGPGLGDVAAGFGDVSVVAKWAAVCAMLLGRLEIFTLLVLVTPVFWRG
ncbi:MAG TPA: TrkH family potassium uptake protein [Gammaproteobacteria bacterium]|nr:TrkH family potassium uptake protein [Gammaproteobacteria bacterium]